MKPKSAILYSIVGLAFTTILAVAVLYQTGDRVLSRNKLTYRTVEKRTNVIEDVFKLRSEDIDEARITISTQDGKTETKSIDISLLDQVHRTPVAEQVPVTVTVPISPRESLVLWIVGIAAVAYMIYFVVVLFVWARHILTSSNEPPAFLKDHLDKAVATLIGLVIGFTGGANLGAMDPAAEAAKPVVVAPDPHES